MAAPTNKRIIRTPAAFVGKRVNPVKWSIPRGYALCEMTGKLFSEADLERTFSHWAFEKSFLVQHHIYIEDAAWLSDEGYTLIMIQLQKLGVETEYHEIAAGWKKGCIGGRTPSSAGCVVGSVLQ